MAQTEPINILTMILNLIPSDLFIISSAAAATGRKSRDKSNRI